MTAVHEGHILCLFALTPLANLHRFLIYTSHFQFNTFWVVYFHLFNFFYWNIIFDLCTLFQQCN
jgi:hypothetical protein